ncbi:MAG: hypothetical protein LAN84_08475 [Acidobacteriia bacterium]|nr:hypothetical protein [Terriglobia bacterium]
MLASHIRERRRAATGPAGGIARSPASGGTLIPYDYAAKFKITGQPGNIVQDVIAISPDSVFVAVAIGYGFEQHRVLPLEIFKSDQVSGAPIAPGDLTLGDLPRMALIEGFRVDPGFENLMFQLSEDSGHGESNFNSQKISRDLINHLFQRVCRPAEISFLYSLVDSGSGREMQDEPVLSWSGIGEPSGRRPFRPLAQPLSFLPRSTIRVQVEERTSGVTGELFIVLYGYKIWTGAACPEPAAQALEEAAVRRGWPQQPGAPVIPFDYVAKCELKGRPGTSQEDEITISTEGAFVATALGYGLAVEEEGVKLAPTQGNNVVNLAQLPLRNFPPLALLDGIRIRKEYMRIALQAGGQLSQDLSPELADAIFERVNQSEDVSFRYTIYDSGTGQGWQNMPLNNVAGLGIANGLRPFKRLARPMVFRPRSTLRVTVNEHFGRGWLYLAFQGYKVLQAECGGAS